MEEILWDDLVLSVSQNSLQWSLLGSFVKCLHNFVIGGFLLNSDCQINDWNIDCWNSEGHACQFSFNFWDDQANSLCSTCWGWNDVSWGSSASSPIFSSLWWSINNQLCSCGCMNSCHKSLKNILVYIPSTIPNWSLTTLATGAKQLVVHEAFDTMCCDDW